MYTWNQAYQSPYDAYGIDGMKHSVGSVHCLAEAAYADGDTLALATETYEIEKAAGVTPGNIAVPLAGGETAAQVAAILLALIQANEPLLHAELDPDGVTIRMFVLAYGPEYLIGTTGGFQDEVTGLLGGQQGAGQPARFGPVRAMHIGSGDGRQMQG
jgi:hypothetical protein